VLTLHTTYASIQHTHVRACVCVCACACKNSF